MENFVVPLTEATFANFANSILPLFWGFIDKANLDQVLAKNLMLLSTLFFFS
jgi:hypothetical protein